MICNDRMQDHDHTSISPLDKKKVLEKGIQKYAKI